MFRKNYILQMDSLILNGRPAPGAPQLLDAMWVHGIPYLILSEQSGRTREQIADMLNAGGFQNIRPSSIYTSVMAAIDWIMMNEPERKKAAYIGGGGIRQTLEQVGFTVRHSAPDVLFVGMNRNMTYKDYSDALQALLHGARLISTDSRKTQVFEGQQMIGNEAVVKMLEYASGVPAVHFGRGTEMLIRMALRYMQVTKDDVIITGHDFEKDIIPGIEMGIETILITNGESIMEMGITEDLHPTYIVEDLYGLAR